MKIPIFVAEEGVSITLRGNCIQPTISGIVKLDETTSSSVYTSLLDIYKTKEMKYQTFKIGDKTCIALVRKLTERVWQTDGSGR